MVVWNPKVKDKSYILSSKFIIRELFYVILNNSSRIYKEKREMYQRKLGNYILTITQPLEN
jgi:hypothetical protein